MDLAFRTRARTNSPSGALAILEQEVNKYALNPLSTIQLDMTKQMLEEDKVLVEASELIETCVEENWTGDSGISATLSTLEYGWERGIFDTLMHAETETPEGVVHCKSQLPEQSLASINAAIDAFRDRSAVVDYHPGSRDRVRDILHPSLFPYITKAETASERETYAGVTDVKPGAVLGAKRKRREEENDDFGRVYRGSRYQWMPSEVHVDDHGVPRFISPVNGAHLQEDADVRRCLESVLSMAIPAWEHVLGYTKSMHWTDYQTGRGCWKVREQRKLLCKPVSLRGKQLQVIPKIADIELTAGGDTHEGVWHVEGLSHERIVATALVYLRKDTAVEGGSLLFRRSFTTDETMFLAANTHQNEAAESPLLSSGLIPLGKLTPDAGDLVAFPNSHQHKLQPVFTSAITNYGAPTSPPRTVVTRRVVAFFLVDPSRRIVSTADVVHLPDAVLDYETRCRIRLAMMAERSAAKKDLNEELSHNFNFCEH
eukprot:ANDGO_04718.mRNA.1 hypothetical protein PHYSODRAFT_488630